MTEQHRAHTAKGSDINVIVNKANASNLWNTNADFKKAESNFYLSQSLVTGEFQNKT